MDKPVFTPEQIKDNALAQFDHTEAKLQEFANLSKDILIGDTSDTQGYELALQAKSRLVKIRTSLEAKREEIKKPFLTLGREIDAYAKKLKAVVGTEEERLTKMIEAHEQALAAEEAERVRLEEYKYTTRKNALQGAECTFDDGMIYQEGVGIATVEEMRDMDEEEFTVLYRHVLDEAEGIRAKRKKQEEALAELERLKQQTASPEPSESTPTSEASTIPDRLHKVINDLQVALNTQPEQPGDKSVKDWVIVAGKAISTAKTLLEDNFELRQEATKILLSLRELAKKL